MKSIARWSSINIIAARFLIGFCHIFILVLGCYVGIALQLYEVVIPAQLFWIFASLFALTFLVSYKIGYFKISFYKRKIFDFAVLLCSFIMIISLANQKTPASFTSYNYVQASFTNPLPVSGSKPSIKELKKQFKELKTILKRDRPTAGAVIGAILIGLLLAGVVASASCSLACNGQDGLAVLVLLAGLTGIFFVVKLLLRTKKSPPKTSTENAKPTNQLG